VVLLNRSAEPDWVVRAWLPRGLAAERVVFLPDACPGRSPLPTGTAVLTRQADWRRFAVSDCGCGMRLLASRLAPGDLDAAAWEAVAARLRARAGGLGDLGGGNHFLDALAPHDGGPLHFLCHTGSRAESGLVDALVDRPAEFDREFARVSAWARDNRAAVQAALEAVVGPLELVLDLAHNGHEPLPDGGALLRKGAVRLAPGERTVIPSHLAGDVALVRATAGVEPLLRSMSHGTGRAAARGEAKALGAGLDVAALRRRVLIPASIPDSVLRGEGPHAYRDLDACLALVQEAVEVERRFAVVAYLGRL
jgi:RNA-splicing ligase RtcB